MLQRKVVGWNGATDLKGNSKILLAPRCKCPHVMHTKPKALFSCFPPVSICTFGQMMVQTGELLAADRNRALTGVGRPTDGSSHTIPFRRNFTARRVGTCQMTVTPDQIPIQRKPF